MAAVTATDSTEDAVIITAGIAAAAITSAGTTAVIAIIIEECVSLPVFAVFAFVTHCPGDVRMQRCEQVAPSRRGRFSRG